MDSVAVAGAGGFIGSRLVQALQRTRACEVRALYRRQIPAEAASDLVALRGDLCDASALHALLTPGGTLVNCVYDAAATPGENVACAERLAKACAERGVRRVVHCSTAAVVGRAAHGRIDENTPAQPATPYERTKLEIERVFARRAGVGYELAILRPTAVFGAGGRGLMKLAEELDRGPRALCYLRSCVNGRRRLNLVAVENVVAAIAFLIATPRALHGDVFIVSDDDARENNYRDVELALMRALDVPDYALPRVAVPPALLAAFLRLRGRTMTDPGAVFAGEGLEREGFAKPVAFERSLAAFAQWYRGEAHRGARVIA